MCDAPPAATMTALARENMEVSISHVKAHRPGDPVWPLRVHQQVGHHDPVVDFGGGLARGLGNDRLITLAVDYLPVGVPLVLTGFRVPHDRETPFLELVHGGVDMPADIVDQILAHHAHQIVARVADVVFRTVLVPLACPCNS